MRVELEFLRDGLLHERVVRQAIMNARRTVLIASALVKTVQLRGPGGRLEPVAALFDRLIAKGVRVFLLAGEAPGRGFVRALKEHPRALRELEMRLCRRNHTKVVLVDCPEGSLYIGSANLTGAGLGARADDKRNFEFGVLTRDGKLIERVSRSLAGVWEGKPCSTCRLTKQCQKDHAQIVDVLPEVRLQIPREFEQ